MSELFHVSSLTFKNVKAAHFTTFRFICKSVRVSEGSVRTIKNLSEECWSWQKHFSGAVNFPKYPSVLPGTTRDSSFRTCQFLLLMSWWKHLLSVCVWQSEAVTETRGWILLGLVSKEELEIFFYYVFLKTDTLSLSWAGLVKTGNAARYNWWKIMWK